MIDAELPAGKVHLFAMTLWPYDFKMQ